MELRKLKLEDAPLMYEWLHDENVIKYLDIINTDKTMDDCKDFIIKSWNCDENLHLAVIDDTGTYMGTVSLKHIDMEQKEAEFAIALRSSAMGLGFSDYGMREILRIGYEEKDLERIYWYVNTANKRAIRFYDKRGYQRMDLDEKPIRGGYWTRDISGIRQEEQSKKIKYENLLLSHEKWEINIALK